MRPAVAILCATFLLTAHAEQQPQPGSADIAALTQRAEQGDADAQKTLADAFLNGHGVPQDGQRGRQWMERSAAQDHVPALAYLAYAHLRDTRSFERDLSRSLQYIERADATNTADGAYTYGTMIINGWYDSLIDAKPRRRAAARLEFAHENGNKDAAAQLARGWRAGWFGEAANGEKARKWHETWAETGTYLAHEGLAQMYDAGTLLPRDFQKALHHYTRASELLAGSASGGERHTLSVLSRMHFRMAELHELKQPPDIQSAFELYQKSQESDSALREARIVLDHGDPQVFPNVLGYLAEQGREYSNAPAMCLLMRVLREGRPGFPAQPETAAEWWGEFERVILDDYRVLDKNAKWEKYNAALCNQDAACRKEFTETKDAVCGRAYVSPPE